MTGMLEMPGASIRPPPSPQAAEQSMTNAPRVWSWRGLRLQPLPAQEQRCGAASADTRRSPCPTRGALGAHRHRATWGRVPPHCGASPPRQGLTSVFGEGSHKPGSGCASKEPPLGSALRTLSLLRREEHSQAFGPPRVRKCSGPLLSPRHRGQAQPRTPHHPLIPPNSIPKQGGSSGWAGHRDTLLSGGGGEHGAGAQEVAARGAVAKQRPARGLSALPKKPNCAFPRAPSPACSPAAGRAGSTT